MKVLPDNAWKEFDQLVAQAKQVMMSPPVMGDGNNRAFAMLILGVADLHARVVPLEKSAAPKIIMPGGMQ